MKTVKMISFWTTAVALIVGLNSCNEEEKAEPTPRPTPDIPGNTYFRFNYSVQVIPSSEAGRLQGVNNATVTISQNGTNLTVNTNLSGIATFPGLVVGPINVFVSAPGFASVNFSDDLQPPAGQTQNDTLVKVFSLREEVTLPIRGCRVFGYLSYDSDQNASTQDVPATGFRVRFETSDKTIQPNVFYASVAQNGSFEFTNLPESFGSLSFDTIIDVQGQLLQFNLTSFTTTPRLGNGVDVGFRRLTTSTTFLRKSGTLTFKPFGDFDYLTPTGTFRQEDEVLPAGVTVVIDYSNDTDYPATQNPLYTGTRAGDGRWTFTDLPVNTNQTGEVKFLFEREIPLGPSNCVVIPGGQTASSGVSGCTGLNNTEVYRRRVQFNSFVSSANNSVNFGGTENLIIDRGEIQVLRPGI